MDNRKDITILIPAELGELIGQSELFEILKKSDPEEGSPNIIREEYGTELKFKTCLTAADLAERLLPHLEARTRYLRRDPDADSWHFDILHDNEIIIAYRENDPQNESLEEGWNWGI